MRMCSIASGSSGNCIYIGTDATHLLVDAGISCKRTVEGLNQLGLTGKDIDGILITHEHSDHIGGLGVLCRKFGIPIYATEGTITAIKKVSNLGVIDDSLFRAVKADEKFILKDITVNPMKISHDAVQPVAYRFQYGSRRMAVATDLGTYDEYTVECLRGMDALLLEANHDINMLQVGPYPYALKQRILGNKGHLSNELSGRLLSRLLHDNLKTVFLGHLSKENNMAELAYETVRLEISMAENPYKPDDFPIFVANRSEMSQLVEI
ncbi:MAG: MBL fold metallo-hydrolase [Lachnospiraceae bacterium]|nr:MBL fold metallo-hydrolase [Lachnospiraceae bacterium]